MEQKPNPELPPQTAEEELQQEYGLETLAEHLGFYETPKLAEIRHALMEAHTSGDQEAVRALIEQFQFHGEILINERESPDYAEAQIGLIIATAMLRKDIGKLEDCVQDLQDAIMYADNMDYDIVVAKLEESIAEITSSSAEVEPQPSTEIANALTPYEEDGLDPETRAEIAALPFEEAYEMAYGYLMQAGLDADEILAGFVEE